MPNTVDTSRTPSLPEVIANAIDAAAQDIHVALPAQVQSYDPSTQTVSVQPLLKRPLVAADGTQTADTPPVLNGIPVQFPAGGGMRLTFPIASGDTGLLVFSEQSLDIWKQTGGLVDPVDLRRNHLSDAVFLPGVQASPTAWKNANPSIISIGSDNGAADFAALASKVLSNLNALKTAINGWTPVPNDGGLALKTALSTLFATWPTSVASTTVEIKG